MTLRTGEAQETVKFQSPYARLIGAIGGDCYHCSYGGHPLKEDSKLRQLRLEIDVTRQDLIRVADISIGTIRNCEKGRRINARSALQILKAINYWLQQKNVDHPSVTIEDLDLNIV